MLLKHKKPIDTTYSFIKFLIYIINLTAKLCQKKNHPKMFSLENLNQTFKQRLYHLLKQLLAKYGSTLM